MFTGCPCARVEGEPLAEVSFQLVPLSEGTSQWEMADFVSSKMNPAASVR